MTAHRYPPDSLVADYLRGGLGFVLTVLPLLLLDLHWAVALLLAACAALFAAFTARTLQRQMTVIHVGEQGIAAQGPLGTAIAWPELVDLRLHYFSTRRDRQKGWMHLTLKGGGRTLRLESSIAGFEAIAARAADAAQANGLSLPDATESNLVAMGLIAPPPPESGWSFGAERPERPR